MLKRRLISVLTFKEGVLFRTKGFVPDYRYTANFVDAFSIDEIVLLDITRDTNGLDPKFLEVVESFARKCFVPIAAGGGVRSIDDFTTLLRSGADKVVINSAAVENPDLITEASAKFGSQCVVLSMDCLRNNNDGYEVMTRCGQKATGLAPEDWAKKAEGLGAGEIVVNSIELDGSLEGYDLELLRKVTSAVSVPTLAAGGAGKWQDFVDAISEADVSAVCTTCIYHFTETSVQSAKNYMHRKHIDVRLG